MKRFITILLAAVLVISATSFAFADMGAPMYNDWYVVVGPAGYEGYAFGTSCQVRDYYGSSYTLMIEGKFANVSEEDFNKYFIPNDERIGPEIGTKLDKEVVCTVAADAGLLLRTGPSRGFKDIALIPNKTELKYQYTFPNGGYTWGYTTYNGVSGWCSIDYTEKKGEVEPEETKPESEDDEKDKTESDDKDNEKTEETDKDKSEDKNEDSAESEDENEDSAESEDENEDSAESEDENKNSAESEDSGDGANEEKTDEKTDNSSATETESGTSDSESIFSSTSGAIIAIAIIAAFIALIALLTLLIRKKKSDNN